MASENTKNQVDGSSPEMEMKLQKEAKEQEHDQNLMTNSSLHQVELGDSLQQVKSAGIPPVSEVDFKPTTKLYLAFGTLAVITLMVALDGTSLSVALPVSSFPILPTYGDQY